MPYTRLLPVFLSLLWANCVVAQLAYPARDDSEFMANVLTRLAKRADPLANIYLNKQRAEGMSSIMDQPMSMGKRINMGVRIAQERIRAGDTRAGIADLERILAIVEAGQVPATDGFIFMLHDQLGIAWLRLREQENCLENHTTDSCLLPIRENGVHTLRGLASGDRALRNQSEKATKSFGNALVAKHSLYDARGTPRRRARAVAPARRDL